MALNDNTRVIPGTGYIHSAPVGVAKPTNMTQPAAPWEETPATRPRTASRSAAAGGTRPRMSDRSGKKVAR